MDQSQNKEIHKYGACCAYAINQNAENMNCHRCVLYVCVGSLVVVVGYSWYCSARLRNLATMLVS